MSNINPLLPVQGAGATTQSIRDNFAATKNVLDPIEGVFADIYPNDVYFNGSKRLYISGGASFASNYVSISGGCSIMGEFGLSGGAHYVYQSSGSWQEGQAAFCGSLFNLYAYRYGANYYSYLNLHPREMYVSGNEVRWYPNNTYMSGQYLSITSETYMSGNSIYITAPLFISGGNNAHNMYTYGLSSAFSCCGSLFNVYEHRTPPFYYQYSQMYLSAQEIYVNGNNFYVSAWTSLSGGLGISNYCSISGDYLSVTARMTVSGYHPRSLELRNSYTPNGYAIYVAEGSTWKPGGGTWGGTSDARTKTDVKAYEAGLKELVQLDAQSFRYNGRGRIQETGKRFISVAAEQAREVMPEMVSSVREKLEYDDEEATDILQVNATPLIYASLNAIKEIAKTLERVEQRLTALEDKDK